MRTILIIDEIRMMAPEVALIDLIGTAASPQAGSEHLFVRSLARRG